MTYSEWIEHRNHYIEFFNSIPLEQRPEAEALYQAFRSRILCELLPPDGENYGGRLGHQGNGQGAAL